MKISRRSFLAISGAAITAGVAAKLGISKRIIPEDYRIAYADTVTTVCPICGVGCGVLCYVENGQIVAIEGDPDNPINEGSLCSKGSALFNMYYTYNAKSELVPNQRRMTKVLYRAPRAKDWEVKDWDWALENMARRIKDTRDKYFEEKNGDGVTVNRCTALSWLGSAMCNNEENYLFHKFARAHGFLNIDHCARL
jgi:formate dehydrogenase major subunit